jgi:hypothetical protein
VFTTCFNKDVLLQPIFGPVFKTRKLSSAKQSQKILGNSALLNPTFGGTMAGAMHAITGPDHLTGLIAPCANRGAVGGALVGAVWGIGHGISTVIVGMTLFYLKSQLSAYEDVFDKINKYSSALVGLSLMLIGLFGMFEAWSSSVGSNFTSGQTTFTKEEPGQKASIPFGLIFGNGLLHGFSIDGAVSLVPSLAVSSAFLAMVYLVSYSLSTMLVISAAAAFISAGISKLETLLDTRVPQKLAYYSSIFSLLIGLFWTVQSTRDIWLFNLF